MIFKVSLVICWSVWRNPTDSLGRWLFPKIKGKDSCRQTKIMGVGRKWMKNRMHLSCCHLFIFHFATYHYYCNKYRNLKAHQSSSVTSSVFLINILGILVQRCCSCSSLGFSGAVAARLPSPPCLVIMINTVLPLCKGFSLLVGFFFPHPCCENKTTKSFWGYWLHFFTRDWRSTTLMKSLLTFNSYNCCWQL